MQPATRDVGPGKRGDNRKRDDHDRAVAPQYCFKRKIHSRLAHYSTLAQIDMSELRVGIGQCELHRT